MKKLFLTSSFSDVYLDFRACIQDELMGKTVSFIPTASKPESVTFYVENDRLAFEKLGMKVEILNIDEDDPKTIVQALTRNDYIFVSGGNTFYLLQELRRSKMDQVIVQLIQRGKPYIGSSAGSIVLGADLEYIKTMDDYSQAPDLLNTAGLDVLPFSILPHFGDAPFSEITNQIFNEFHQKHVLVPLNNRQFIYLD